MKFKDFFNEGLKLKTNKPFYKTGKDFTVFKSSDNINLGIEVDSSSGWLGDDDSDTFKLMSNGRNIVTVKMLDADWKDDAKQFARKLFDVSEDNDFDNRLSSSDYVKVFKEYVKMSRELYKSKKKK